MRHKSPLCPHCGCVYDIDDRESYHLYTTDDIEELDCNDCGNVFFVDVFTTFSFETQKDIDDF